MQGKPPYPFAEKQTKYRAMSDAGLAYNLKDAREARDVCGTIDASTFAFYADDVSTILDEIARRKRAK